MQTRFTAEEWDEFREECQLRAWNAIELRSACWKAVALIERSYETAPDKEVRFALARLRREYLTHLDELSDLQRHCEACDKDEASQANDTSIGLASYAIRKIAEWPQLAARREEASSRPVEYSRGDETNHVAMKAQANANLDKLGVWRVHFSLD